MLKVFNLKIYVQQLLQSTISFVPLVLLISSISVLVLLIIIIFHLLLHATQTYIYTYSPCIFHLSLLFFFYFCTGLIIAEDIMHNAWSNELMPPQHAKSFVSNGNVGLPHSEHIHNANLGRDINGSIAFSHVSSANMLVPLPTIHCPTCSSPKATSPCTTPSYPSSSSNTNSAPSPASTSSISSSTSPVSKLHNNGNNGGSSRTSHLWSWTRTTLKSVYAFRSAGRSRRVRSEGLPTKGVDDCERIESSYFCSICGPFSRTPALQRCHHSCHLSGRDFRPSSCVTPIESQDHLSSLPTHSQQQHVHVRGCNKIKDSDGEDDEDIPDLHLADQDVPTHVTYSGRIGSSSQPVSSSTSNIIRRRRSAGSRLWSWARTSIRSINAFQSAGRLRRRRENSSEEYADDDDGTANVGGVHCNLGGKAWLECKEEEDREEEQEENIDDDDDGDDDDDNAFPGIVRGTANSERLPLLPQSTGDAHERCTKFSVGPSCCNASLSDGEPLGHQYTANVTYGGHNTSSPFVSPRLRRQLLTARPQRDSIIEHDDQPPTPVKQEAPRSLFRQGAERLLFQLRVVRAFRNGLIRRMLLSPDDAGSQTQSLDSDGVSSPGIDCP